MHAHNRVGNPKIILFSVLKKAFDAFDREKNGCISTEMVGTILEMLGHRLDDDMLAEIIAEVDADGEYCCPERPSIVTFSDTIRSANEHWQEGNFSRVKRNKILNLEVERNEGFPTFSPRYLKTY
jgi:hypothetical protein